MSGEMLPGCAELYIVRLVDSAIACVNRPVMTKATVDGINMRLMGAAGEIGFMTSSMVGGDEDTNGKI